MNDPSSTEANGASADPKERTPRQVIPDLWLFAPNRDTQGGSSWLLETEMLSVLIDCPAATSTNLSFLQSRTDGWIVLTGRSGHGRCEQIHRKLGWPIVVQEQEAYLLPGIGEVTTFEQTHQLGDGVRLLWTPGPSPGACVLHVSPHAWAGGHGLCCGRLLIPVAPGRVMPLRNRSNFHWLRQLRSLDILMKWLPAGSPDWIASGAPLGALRGQNLVWEGARQLASLDLEALATSLSDPFNP